MNHILSASADPVNLKRLPWADYQGTESRLTRLWQQRAENVQQVLRVPGGALAAALD
jgi:hypothetical protein